MIERMNRGLCVRLLEVLVVLVSRIIRVGVNIISYAMEDLIVMGRSGVEGLGILAYSSSIHGR